MRGRILWIMNGVVVMGTVALLLLIGTAVPERATARQNLPGPAADTVQVTGLAFVTFSGGSGEGTDGEVATTQTYPVDESGDLLESAAPQTLSSQLEPASCETDSAQAAPKGDYLVLTYNCEANTFAQFVALSETTDESVILPRGYFLDWSPDGDWFLFREADSNEIWLTKVAGKERFRLELPDGTYRAIFTPDGRRVLYVASAGLGFGSEMGLLDLESGKQTVWQQQVYHIIATPRWSPDGSQLAYILMPDSNVPYTVGELWLADSTGQPVTMLDQADAGHGYPPVWAPDGQSLIYVRRENPDSPIATFNAEALHSNIYQVDVTTGAITQLTHFTESLVYDVVWSPDGSQLAFTAQDAVWSQTLGQEPVQISPAGEVARHPTWLLSADSQKDEE